MHHLVHRSLRLYPEVSFVPINRLPLPREIDLAVVPRCGSGLHSPDELMLFVHHDMQFVPEVRLFPFLCPGAVPAPPGLGLLSPRRVRRFMAGIGGDEARVLDHPFLYREILYFKLRLQLIPDGLLFPALDQPLPEVPEGGVIRYLLRESRNFRKEMRSLACRSISGSERP